MDDQAETVLMRLIRGSGVRGLSAMKPISENLFIKPLLATSRSEVLTFLDEREIPYREDSSNLDTAFLRNRIRHGLLEVLKEDYNPRMVETLCSHASILGEADDYLCLMADRAYEKSVIREPQENIELELATFLSYHTCIQGYIFREAYRRLCGSLRNLDFCHIDSLLRLASSGQTGSSLDIPSGVSAWLEGKSLVIGFRARRPEQIVTSEFLVPLEPGGAVWLSDISLGIDSKLFRTERPIDDFTRGEPDRVFFDFEKLEPPLVLRNLNPGDRISPFGMKGSKKIQDLLVDMKMPRQKRRALAALCDGSQILWLVGARRGRAAPITEETRMVLELRAITDSKKLPGKDAE
jgi:tRNA(Ile)-lysidine synthase